MIRDHAPVTNTFVSVPADMGHLNCASFLAGVIAGVLDSARFVSNSIIHELPVSVCPKFSISSSGCFRTLKSLHTCWKKMAS